jgi:hypothetical protein
MNTFSDVRMRSETVVLGCGCMEGLIKDYEAWYEINRKNLSRKTQNSVVTIRQMLILNTDYNID